MHDNETMNSESEQVRPGDTAEEPEGAADPESVPRDDEMPTEGQMSRGMQAPCTPSAAEKGRT